MSRFVKIGVISALAAYVAATGGGWQAENAGWNSGPSFSWKQGTHQGQGLDGRSGSTGWINPAIPSSGGGGGDVGGWQGPAPAVTHHSSPVSYSSPGPSAGGAGWTAPVVRRPSPSSYSGWQGPSAPIRVVPSRPQPSAGYSVTWTAPPAARPAAPIGISYGGSGGGRVWQMPIPVSAGWTSVPVIVKSAGWTMGPGGWPVGMGNRGGPWGGSGGPGGFAGGNQWMAMAGGD